MTTISNIRREFNTDFDCYNLAFEIDGTASIEWLDEDYTYTLCVEYESNLRCYLDAETAAEIRATLADWLAKNEEGPYTLTWISKDTQGSIEMGEFSSHADAEAAMPGALQELLDQCNDDTARVGINEGTFTILAA